MALVSKSGDLYDTLHIWHVVSMSGNAKGNGKGNGEGNAKGNAEGTAKGNATGNADTALLWGTVGMLGEPKAGGNPKGKYEEEARVP